MSRKEHPAAVRARLAYQESIVLAQWYAAECAAERAAKWRARRDMAAMVAIYLTSASLVVAVGLLLWDVVS
jgi:hypothetical protein